MPQSSKPQSSKPQSRRLRATLVVTLAMMSIFTLAAGVAVATLMPARLALWNIPRVAAHPPAAASQVLPVARSSAPLPTGPGLSAALSPILGSRVLGKQAGAEVVDPGTGRVLFARGASTLIQPASTTKLVTAIAALDVLGPSARFTTRVVSGTSPGSIVLVGGGDPTLAAGPVPASDYPQPATLKALATATARALHGQGRHSVRLSYDASLFTGPPLAPGWPTAYITTGNVTAITSLEVDQGRLTLGGAPQDADDPGNLRPRSTDPAGQAAQAFAAYLSADGIRVTGPGGPQKAAAHAATIASVSSPPLSAIVSWMLRESNNVIAENLARQVALRERRPASFSGAAAAITAIARRLGVAGGIHLVRRLGPVSAGPDRPGRAGPPGQPGVGGYPGPPAGRHHRHAGGRLLRHAGLRAERLRRIHRPLPRPDPGQDRQPEQRGHLGRAGLRRQRTAAGLRVHDRPGTAHGPRQGRGWARPDGLRTGRLRLPRPVNRGPSQGTTGQQAAPALPSTYGGGVSSGQMIDWDVAISTGVRWARPGPQVSLGEARAVVAELRALADQVSEPVRAVTGMSGPGEDGSGWVAVVDRPGWIRANVDGFRVVLDPLAERLRERGNAPGGAVVTAVGSRVTGVQAGLILAYLSGRVLGQYELFLPPDPSSPNGVAPAAG